jgi:hypothetical protein
MFTHIPDAVCVPEPSSRPLDSFHLRQPSASYMQIDCCLVIQPMPVIVFIFQLCLHAGTDFA